MMMMIEQQAIQHVVDDVMRGWSKRTTAVTKDVVLCDFFAEQHEMVETFQKMKCLHMKVGTIWQRVMGLIPGVTSLPCGHVSGLDVMSDGSGRFAGGYEFVMELKNASRSDNASSRKQNVRKLCAWATQVARMPIYGIINGGDEDRWIEAEDGGRYRYLSGKCLLRFLFGGEELCTIEYIKRALKQYI
jgi:hypothetical protein